MQYNEKKHTMTIEIRVPEAGESITQVELARWLVEDGAFVEKDQEIAEIDSDKATLTINADAAGKIHIDVDAGSTVEPGKIIGKIDTTVAGNPDEKVAEKSADIAPPSRESEIEREQPAEQKEEKPDRDAKGTITITPQAKKLLEEHGLPTGWDHINPDSKRITKKDILAAISGRFADKAPGDKMVQKSDAGKYGSSSRDEQRNKMSTLRKKVAERLVSVKNQTAMLTTFNEVDMSAIIALRKKHQIAFTEKYGFKLGFMSFFVKALTESIPYFPQVNGYIDSNHIILPDYADVGIAVSTPKGLMVPVIRNAESMTIPDIESEINELAEKARNNKITIEELTGGTISITNGGVFGSMLSTPIINPPQSAILGMHNIIERPVAVQGKVEIRPMMYLALSYDHRIVDGKESVSFLVNVKEMIENPVRMLLSGKGEGEAILRL